MALAVRKTTLFSKGCKYIVEHNAQAGTVAAGLNRLRHIAGLAGYSRGENHLQESYVPHEVGNNWTS